jgi:hypothetical protein
MTVSGRNESESKFSKPLRIILAVVFGIMIFFEGFKAFNMYGYWMAGDGLAIFIYSACACLFTIGLFALTVAGWKKVPILWYIIGALNLLTIFFGLFGASFSQVERVFGMPLNLAYIYFGLHILLFVLLIFYGWSLNRPTVDQEIVANKKAKNFGEFLASKENHAG